MASKTIIDFLWHQLHRASTRTETLTVEQHCELISRCVRVILGATLNA